MINIVSAKGENYSFDPQTLRIFKDGVLLSSSKVEPLFSSNTAPEFCGIYLKSKATILKLNGNEEPAITNINNLLD